MITLSNKTADWIANIAREQLQDIQEAQDATMSEIAELEAEAIKLIKAHPEWEGARENLEKVKAESLAKNNAYLREETAKWQKIIELMIIGDCDGSD